jgi:oxaloacetate decarboxylase alpha subunit
MVVPAPLVSGEQVNIEFIDQTLRDGQQSLWGLQMRAYQAAEALPHLDRTGFRVIDLTGAGMFTVLIRNFKENPWEVTDFLVKNLPNSKVRSASRTISVGGMGFAPDSVVDLWIRTLAHHGISSFWFFDCLYGMEKLHRLNDVIADAGATPVPAVMYGLTDVHTDEFFAARAKEMAAWRGVESVYMEDAPGVLTPERAGTLFPALKEATGDVPLELHCHNTTGLAPLVYLEGIRHGIHILHTASRAMANGPSLPSTEAMVDNVTALGHTHGLDVSQLTPVAENFAREADAAGYEVGVPHEYSVRNYGHQLPGGMMGSLKRQLAEHGMEDRLQEVLDEIPRVREELGQPIMATPFSQFVGIQALLNVVTGDRYSVVPTEVVQYTLGHYGPLMRPVNPEVADRILDDPKIKEFENWEQPQPTLKDLRDRFGHGISDEELVLRALFSGEEIDGMLAAGPPCTDPRMSASVIVGNIKELIGEPRRARSLTISQPGMTLQLVRHER